MQRDRPAQSNGFHRFGPNGHVRIWLNVMARHLVETTLGVEHVKRQRQAVPEEPPEGRFDTCDHPVEVIRGMYRQRSPLHTAPPM